MPVAPESLTKGTEVWHVKIKDGNGLLMRPELHHGVVTGGGLSQVLIQWDHIARIDRGSLRWMADWVSATALEAWQDAYVRLGTIRTEAAITLHRADAARLHVNREM